MRPHIKRAITKMGSLCIHTYAGVDSECTWTDEHWQRPNAGGGRCAGGGGGVDGTGGGRITAPTPNHQPPPPTLHNHPLVTRQYLVSRCHSYPITLWKSDQKMIRFPEWSTHFPYPDQERTRKFIFDINSRPSLRHSTDSRAGPVSFPTSRF
ncbi:hypothetical protein J6590_067445 [Homalodisca vitripennis]|nr:hypothetical protein J6590_067445 [Homalodisca vitripennis]